MLIAKGEFTKDLKNTYKVGPLCFSVKRDDKEAKDFLEFSRNGTNSVLLYQKLKKGAIKVVFGMGGIFDDEDYRLICSVFSSALESYYKKGVQSALEFSAENSKVKKKDEIPFHIVPDDELLNHIKRNINCFSDKNRSVIKNMESENRSVRSVFFNTVANISTVRPNSISDISCYENEITQSNIIESLKQDVLEMDRKNILLKTTSNMQSYVEESIKTFCSIIKRPLVVIDFSSTSYMTLMGSNSTYHNARLSGFISDLLTHHHTSIVILLKNFIDLKKDKEGDLGEAFLGFLNRKFTDQFSGFEYDLSEAIVIAEKQDSFKLPMSVREVDFNMVVDIPEFSTEEKKEILFNKTKRKMAYDVVDAGFFFNSSKTLCDTLCEEIKKHRGSFDKLQKKLKEKFANNPEYLISRCGDYISDIDKRTINGIIDKANSFDDKKSKQAREQLNVLAKYCKMIISASESFDQSCKWNDVENKLKESHYISDSLQILQCELENILIARKLNSLALITPLLLVGEPGTGKSSAVKAFAQSVGLPFLRIDMGTIQDSSQLIGSENDAGLILDFIAKNPTGNGFILFDEVDKINPVFKASNIFYRLFDDKKYYSPYLNIDIDLSFFDCFCSANDITKIDNPIINRCKLIKFDSYNQTELATITKKYITKNVGDSLNREIVITNDAINELVSFGVSARELNRSISFLALQYLKSTKDNNKKIYIDELFVAENKKVLVNVESNKRVGF